MSLDSQNRQRLTVKPACFCWQELLVDKSGFGLRLGRLASG